MRPLAIPCLTGVFLLLGCAREAGVPTGGQGAENPQGAGEAEVKDPTLRSLPDISGLPYGYRCDPYIRVAARLQGLGREGALKTLEELARGEDGRGHRVVILCRMLFRKRDGGEFRRPMLGGACFLGGTDYPDWPLEPIELVDGVPFLIVQGYILAGKAESSSGYLRYCVDHCDWNPIPFREKTPAEKAKALDKLIGSARWKAPLQDDERAFLARQVE